MAYARKYTPKEVHDLLKACEGNNNGGNPNSAHTYGQHLNISMQGLTTRVVSEVKEAATKFASEEDLVGAAYEALNSGAGFAELQKLDSKTEKRVLIKHTLVGKYEADVQYGDVWTMPFALDGVPSKQKNVAKKANTFSGAIGGTSGTRALKVVLIVDSAGSPDVPWIQTCYPVVD